MKLIALFALFAVLLVGCTSQGSTTPTVAPTQSATATPEATAQPSVEATAVPTTTPEATVEATATPQATASMLVDCVSAARAWKVDYSVKATTDGTPSTVEMTQYFKSSGSAYKSRTDVTASGVQTRTIVDGSSIKSCFNYAGTWSCQDLSQYASVDVESDVKSNAADYTKDGTMDVAGATATCYKGKPDGNDIRYCISSECVPLFVGYTATSQGKTVVTETKATGFSTTVTDADFTLPA